MSAPAGEVTTFAPLKPVSSGSATALARKIEPEILDELPEYDREGINAIEFMTAVMHCRKLPVTVRLDAANKVAVFQHARLAQVTQDVTAGLTIRIEGGLPQLPGTNIIMPNHGEVIPPSHAKKGNGHDPDA